MKIRFFMPQGEAAQQVEKYFQSHWEESSSREWVFQGIRWQNLYAHSGLTEGAEYTLNPPEGLQNGLDAQRMQQIFALNRIPQMQAETDRVRRLEMLIVDQKLLRIRREQSNGRMNPVRAADYTSAVALAQRVLHVLGLDFAAVIVGMNRYRQYMVERVDLLPALQEADLVLLTAYLESLKSTLPNTGGEIMMGADPEFMLANSRTGKMMAASDFFPRLGRVGCDAVRTPNRRKRPVAEIRPEPAYSPLELMQNIQTVLQEASRYLPYRSVKWLAGSQPFAGFSTGGHVHFSHTAFNGHLLRALDAYAAVPLFLSELPETAAARRKRYGMLGDFRPKEHGGFEYRTLPSWLVAPEWARAVLCLCKTIAVGYPVLQSRLLLNPEVQAAFYAGNRAFFRTIVLEELQPELQRLRIYALYERELDWMFAQIRAGRHWNEKKDIRSSWGIAVGKKR